MEILQTAVAVVLDLMRLSWRSLELHHRTRPATERQLVARAFGHRFDGQLLLALHQLLGLAQARLGVAAVVRLLEASSIRLCLEAVLEALCT